MNKNREESINSGRKKITVLMLYPLLFTLLLVILGSFWIHSLDKKFKVKYEKFLGKQCVIEKDTLLIVDYSILKNSFVLRDGRSVGYSLVEKSTIK